MDKPGFILGCTGAFVTLVFCALSISLLATTDFGEQKRSRDIAISMAVLSGLPFAVVVIAGVVMCIGMCTGKLVWWA